MTEQRICQFCDKPKIIEARGLCKQCYGFLQRSKRLNDFTKDQSTTFGKEDKIVFLYDRGMSILEIARAHNVSKNTIYRTLDRAGRGRSNRKYDVDELAFNSLDNEAAAYWLGFIYADGYIPANRSYLSVGLQIRDESHLGKLKRFLGTTTPIRYYNQKGFNQARLHISSVKLCKKLRDLGIIIGRNKFQLVLENLPINMERHFIRGYIDGDGYICKNGKTPLVRIVGQNDVLDWLNHIFNLRLNIGEQRKYQVGNGYVFTISVAGRIQATRLCDWIYYNSHIYMQRKFESYKNWSTGLSE